MVLLGLFLGGVGGFAAEEDPFLAPPELKDYIFRATTSQLGVQAKLQAFLSSVFRPVAEGGLGVTYDNGRTRTVPEVWRERKANCLSMTAFYVAACKAAGLDVKYAEAINTNRWRKVDGMVRFERHVVAVCQIPPSMDLVADFVPTLRRRVGSYVVNLVPEQRFRALYHSNRAVELLGEGEHEAALAEAQVSVAADGKCSIGWNILGVVRKAQGQMKEAERAYRNALELDPKDSSALGNLEMLCREAGRVEEAGQLRQQGEQVMKRDPYFNAYLGEEALGNGDLVEAKARIAIAQKLLPRESEFFLLRARLKLTEGRLDEAVKDIEEARRWAEPGERERYDSKLSLIKGKQESPK